MIARRRTILALACVVVLQACSDNSKSTSTTSGERTTTTMERDKATPDEVVALFFDGLKRNDAKAVADAVAATSEQPFPFMQQMRSGLGITDLAFSASKAVISEDKMSATVDITTTVTAAPFPAFELRSTLTLSHLVKRWLINWTPAGFDPTFTAQTKFKRSTSWPDRAPIFGAGGKPLTVAASMIRVGIQGSAIKDPAAVTAGLLLTGATPAAITKALATAKAHPSWFVSVIEITEAQYLPIRPKIFPIPGTRFRSFGVRRATSPDLSAHIVGTTGNITKEQLDKWGLPYTEQSTVGRSGLELAFERQLAGTPGGVLQTVDAAGQPRATLATVEPVKGTPVVTTIDPRIQSAAEQAVAGVPGASAIVAIQVSTGKVLASVSQPTDSAFDGALNGHYPPGSTFKIISAANLLEHGLTPTSPLTCPKNLAIGPQTFQNFEGEALGNLDLTGAFTHSCNTAFIGATRSLANPTFPATAAQFGLTTKYNLGLNSYSGAVRLPRSDLERAQSTIGQATITVSPLAMACVAATVASGSWHSPTLVDGVDQTGTQPTKALDPTVAAGLRTMMGAVVTDGTAKGRGLPAGTFGKTGTAEFGTTKPFKTHAWFVGYRGDVAFAVLVDGSTTPVVGGRVAAPIAAKFLTTIG